ncbi:hypothetical protein Misp01_35420 [Microtetraspora sp. NBRC 13810]|uniref:trypsin-like serine peptidase n=1 Tax=Microtetraspora sp. NBRC 13810 TaxID=3030990 RepID=UPI0024A17F9C|nr:peptidase [Microtetraspora sp. NBRC 13810]GLW08412.1 hypothetical protein Misp01_35420 [Microtetraspora sp. NBRC 13810]
MHRTARLVPIVSLAVGGALGAALLPAGTAYGAQAPKPIARAAADSGPEQRTVRKYWTPAKMEAARPLDLPARKTPRARLSPSTGPTASRALPPTGAPVTIPPTAPGKAAGTAPQAQTQQPQAQSQQPQAQSQAQSQSQALAAARATPGATWTRGGAVAKTTGRVFFTYQGRNASCSGSAVTSANKSVVITAGHCVKMGGVFHGNWVFVPGYDRGSRPYGTWVATRLLTTPQWSDDENVDHDLAAAVVAPLDGRSLTEVVGGQGVAFNQGRRRQMHSFGYPAASPYDGSRLTYCSGRAFDDFLLSRGLGLTCAMTGGSSGGPWFLGFDESTGLGTQNSVNSFKYNFAQDWMFAPYFGPEAKAVYDAAQRDGAT